MEVIKKHPLVLLTICVARRWLWLQKVQQGYTESWGNPVLFFLEEKKPGEIA